MSDEQPKLNKKQEMFVESYLKCFNATQAAKDAGYSESSAANQGYRMMRNDDISRAIAQRVAEVAMGADEVLVRLSEVARSSFGDFINESGEVDLKKAKAQGKIHLVRRYSDSEKFGIELELQDQLKALELLGKANGALGTNLRDALLRSLDLNNLTESQLRRLAEGGDVIEILTNPNR